MKKLGAFLVGLGLVAGSAMAVNTATSVNAVGYKNIQLTPGLSLVSCPFVDVASSSGMTIDGLLGTSMPDGSVLYMFNGVSYNIYSYYLGYGWYDDGGNPAGTNVINPGSGFWVQVSTNCTLTLAGSVPSVASNTVSIAEGLQIVGFGYPVSVTASNSVLSPVDGDVIYKFGSGAYSLYTYYAGYGWYDDGGNPANVNLETGEGFWYQRQAGGGATPWVQVKPYVWP